MKFTKLDSVPTEILNLNARYGLLSKHTNSFDNKFTKLDSFQRDLENLKSKYLYLYNWKMTSEDKHKLMERIPAEVTTIKSDYALLLEWKKNFEAIVSEISILRDKNENMIIWKDSFKKDMEMDKPSDNEKWWLQYEVSKCLLIQSYSGPTLGLPNIILTLFPRIEGVSINCRVFSRSFYEV